MSDAIKKLQSEMDKNKSNPYIQVVGEFLLQHLTQSPQDAEKILPADKTIAKSLNKMREAAEKKKVGNCTVLTDQEGFEVVLKYFEIESRSLTSANEKLSPQPVINTHEVKQTAFDVSLEDLLG